MTDVKSLQYSGYDGSDDVIHNARLLIMTTTLFKD